MFNPCCCVLGQDTLPTLPVHSFLVSVKKTLFDLLFGFCFPNAKTNSTTTSLICLIACFKLTVEKHFKLNMNKLLWRSVFGDKHCVKMSIVHGQSAPGQCLVPSAVLSFLLHSLSQRRLLWCCI